MTITTTRDAAELQRLARSIRIHCIRQAMSYGQGYIGQGLQSADLFALLHFGEMNWNPQRLDDPARDRFLLSVGHYAIALYATFATAGLVSDEQLAGYGSDGSHFSLGAEPGHVPGVEFAGGSLGQGLGVACGLAWGLRHRGSAARVFNYMPDGEVQEGSTWEAAMLAGARDLGNLYNIVDVNRTQADGPLVLEIEPLAEKYRAFGWWAEDVDGNDIDALLDLFARARAVTDKPKAIIAHTRIGCGSPTLMESPKSHFVRVGKEAWSKLLAEVELSGGAQ